MVPETTHLPGGLEYLEGSSTKLGSYNKLQALNKVQISSTHNNLPILQLEAAVSCQKTKNRLACAHKACAIIDF